MEITIAQFQTLPNDQEVRQIAKNITRETLYQKSSDCITIIYYKMLIDCMCASKSFTCLQIQPKNMY